MPAKKRPRSKVSGKRVSEKEARKPARAKTRSSRNIALRAVSPSFTVNDIERSLAFYRDVLGFAVKDRWESDGKLFGAEVAAGDVLFMLGQDDWKKGRDRVKGEGFRIYCATSQNIDRLAEQIKARGGTLSQEPADRPWGTRDFTFEDPDGFKITIVSDLKR